jgi:uncharacterized protein YkwD
MALLFFLCLAIAAASGVLFFDMSIAGVSAEDIDTVVSQSDDSLSDTDSTADPDAAATSGTDGVNTTAVRDAVHHRINEMRSDHGLQPLDYDSRAGKSAQQHTEWMAETTTIEHSGDGQYVCRPVAENIAYTYAASDIDTEYGGVVNHHGNETAIGYGLASAWMNSKPHRRNILDEDFNRTGIGIATAETGGRTRIYATQSFCG